MNCLTCPKVDTCTELCPAAKAYYLKDEVEWHEAQPESFYIEGEILRVFNTKTGKDKPLLTPRERLIVNARDAGFSAVEIAKKLMVSKSTVRVLIHRVKNKTVNKVYNQYKGVHQTKPKVTNEQMPREPINGVPHTP